MTAHTEESFLADPEQQDLGFGATMRDVAVVSLIAIPIQLIATDLSLGQVLAGLVAIYAVCLLGVLLTRYVPLKLPSVAWISLVGIAEVSARYWVSNNSTIDREQATQLAATLAWRGIRGFPRTEGPDGPTPG